MRRRTKCRECSMTRRVAFSRRINMSTHIMYIAYPSRNASRSLPKKIGSLGPSNSLLVLFDVSSVYDSCKILHQDRDICDGGNRIRFTDITLCCFHARERKYLKGLTSW